MSRNATGARLTLVFYNKHRSPNYSCVPVWYCILVWTNLQ